MKQKRRERIKEMKEHEKVKDLLNNSFLKPHLEAERQEIPMIKEITYSLGGLFVQDNKQQNVMAINQPSKEEVFEFIQEFAKLHNEKFDQMNPYLTIKTDFYLMVATTKPISAEPTFDFKWKTSLIW